jgi:hypothetical protein
METCGIILAFPIAAVVSVCYARLAAVVFTRSRILVKILLAGSALVLLLAVAEGILLLSKGILGTRASVGPTFEVLHAIVFFLTPPAIANFLLLGRIRSEVSWLRVAILTFIVAITFVFWNIYVDETLYGPDGIGGPYSHAEW